MIRCKRCDIEIYFDNGKPFENSRGIPHSFNDCKTKLGFVWCPEHREVFPENVVCEHYKKYGYVPGRNEQFFLDLIKEKYEPGDWFNRKRKRKTSFDKMKKPAICIKCKTNLDNLDAVGQTNHQKECAKQYTLEACY